MNISLEWINSFLDRPATADEVEHALTSAGFPIEERTTLPDGDVFMDVEITSNRGDCLSMLGLAREVAAVTGRQLVKPEWTEPARDGDVDGELDLENQTYDDCPLFTAQVIKGVKVGESPDWLKRRLEAVGQRPINNLVDVTNYITLELGHPCHVFDLKKLADRTLIIRWAGDGEKLTTLDGKEHTLKPDELVVADGERATSLAGVMGGADSEVDASTTEVVLEMATWAPVTVRRAARRHNLRTDASHRFERGVDMREIDFAAARAAAMIVELAGGQLCQGVLMDGREPEEHRVVSMRPDRCREIMGIFVEDGDMARLLGSHEIACEQAGGELRCTIPPFRLDLEREIDLIEEVARTKGLEAIPIAEKLSIGIPKPQDAELAVREIGNVLTGLGFYEAVTFTFVSPERASQFVPDGIELLGVDDERRKAEPTLRPSAIPSLLACRKANQDAQVHVPGGVRLFEVAHVFGEKPDGALIEHRNVAMLMDVPFNGKKATDDDLQHAVRLMRGSIDALVRAIVGKSRELVVVPGMAPSKACDPNASGGLVLRDADGTEAPLGYISILSEEVRGAYDLDAPVVICELGIAPLIADYPPTARVHELPAFPLIERDVSLLLDDAVPWADVERLVRGLEPDLLDGVSFVGAFRGKQVGQGRKSLTFRLSFRHPDRTLRREEVDPQVEAIVSAARDTFGAEVRV